MALIATGNHPKSLWPGIHKWFGAVYAKHAVEYTGLFDVKGSSQNYEEDAEHSSFGLAPIKPEGQAVVYDSHQQGNVKRYIHTAFALGYVVTREELADNLYKQVSMARAQSLAFSMSQTRENVGANVYNRAFNSSYTGADSVELIATTHTSLAGNQSNKLNPDAALSEAALEDMAIQIMDAKNSRGLKISLMPTTLCIPTALSFEAQRILKSALQNDTANNAQNALKSLNTIPNYVANHYFSSTTAWFVKTNAPNGLCWFDRESVEFSKDNDFDTDNAKAKAYMRFSVGWTDWRGVFGSDGA